LYAKEFGKQSFNPDWTFELIAIDEAETYVKTASAGLSTIGQIDDTVKLVLTCCTFPDML
jgi:hypothetical protein